MVYSLLIAYSWTSAHSNWQYLPIQLNLPDGSVHLNQWAIFAFDFLFLFFLYLVSLFIVWWIQCCCVASILTNGCFSCLNFESMLMDQCCCVASILTNGCFSLLAQKVFNFWVIVLLKSRKIDKSVNSKHEVSLKDSYLFTKIVRI